MVVIKVNLARKCSTFKDGDMVSCKLCGKNSAASEMPKTQTGFRFECKKCHYAKSLARYHEKRKSDPSFSVKRRVRISTTSEAISFYKSITERPEEIRSTGHDEFIASSCGMIYRSFFSRDITGLSKESFTFGVLGKRGYFSVLIKGESFYVHRLVAEAFYGVSELSVNHINRNKADNRLKNLEYVTHRENMSHLNVMNDSKKKAYRHSRLVLAN